MKRLLFTITFPVLFVVSFVLGFIGELLLSLANLFNDWEYWCKHD